MAGLFVARRTRRFTCIRIVLFRFLCGIGISIVAVSVVTRFRKFVLARSMASNMIIPHKSKSRKAVAANIKDLRICLASSAGIITLLFLLSILVDYDIMVEHLGVQSIRFWGLFFTQSQQIVRPNIEDCTRFESPYVRIEKNKSRTVHDQNLCKSRYEQHCYWAHRSKQVKHVPSPAFLAALRNYEHLHQRCTEGHNLTELVLEGKAPLDCKYFVWTNKDGMGNQLISLVSAFIYSILTKRALLIVSRSPVKGVICEPFPSSSWLLPANFPEVVIRQRAVNLGSFFKEAIQNRTSRTDQQYNMSFAKASIRLLKIYLTNRSSKHDLQFFCPAAQDLLKGIPWLFLESHEYSAPGLYFLPPFRDTLNELFPDKATFMHAARYLLNPANDIWDRVIRLYQSYLKEADMLLGIQVRAWASEYHPIISKHILQCGLDTALLPAPIYRTTSAAATISREKNQSGSQRLAVVLASLRPEYHRDLSEVYACFPNANNTLVSVFSPSWEESQQTGRKEHNEKAIADMWLLSFMDDLIVTPRSTFGGVASGLAGIVPVRLLRYGIDKQRLPEPTCGRSNVAGPCFIDHPNHMPCELDFKEKDIADANAFVPEVRRCWGDWGISVYQGNCSRK